VPRPASRPEAAGEPVAAPGGQSAHHFRVDALIGRHRRGGIGIRLIRRAGLGPLRQGQDEHRPEMPRQKAQQPGTQITPAGLADLIPEQGAPMRLVADLGGGQSQQDVAFFPVPACGEVAVHRGLGTFIGQVLPPTAQIRGTRPWMPSIDGVGRGRADRRGHNFLRSRPKVLLAQPGGAPGREAGMSTHRRRPTQNLLCWHDENYSPSTSTVVDAPPQNRRV